MGVVVQTMHLRTLRGPDGALGGGELLRGAAQHQAAGDPRHRSPALRAGVLIGAQPHLLGRDQRPQRHPGGEMSLRGMLLEPRLGDELAPCVAVQRRDLLIGQRHHQLGLAAAGTLEQRDGRGDIGLRVLQRRLGVGPADLTDLVIVQVGALQAMARTEGASVRGVKPHGALYTALAHHAAQAGAVVRALTQLGGLPLVAAPGAVVVDAARTAGIEVVLEGFADRAYLPDGSLAPRSAPGAVLTEPAQVAAQALSIATEGGVRTAEGARVELPVRSLCLHGDTPGAVELARAVRTRLEEAGVRLEAAL